MVKNSFKLVGVLSLAIMLVAGLMFASVSFAETKAINAKISSVVTALDRNGNEYTRLIVEEEQNLNGISFTMGIPAMAFGALNVEAKAVKAGDTIKLIVSKRMFQGRESYTIHKFIK